MKRGTRPGGRAPPPEGTKPAFNTGRDGLLAAFLSPDMLKEAARFKGLAGGIVGYDKYGEPEFLVAVQPGESKIPEFLMRAYLTARADFKKAATVEGIDLFQRHFYPVDDDPLLGGGPPAPRKLLSGGIVLSHAPGLVVIGSNREMVSAAIRRFKEKEKSPSLTSGSFVSCNLVEEGALQV